MNFPLTSFFSRAHRRRVALRALRVAAPLCAAVFACNGGILVSVAGGGAGCGAGRRRLSSGRRRHDSGGGYQSSRREYGSRGAARRKNFGCRARATYWRRAKPAKQLAAQIQTALARTLNNARAFRSFSRRRAARVRRALWARSSSPRPTTSNPIGASTTSSAVAGGPNTKASRISASIVRDGRA